MSIPSKLAQKLRKVVLKKLYKKEGRETIKRVQKDPAHFKAWVDHEMVSPGIWLRRHGYNVPRKPDGSIDPVESKKRFDMHRKWMKNKGK